MSQPYIGEIRMVGFNFAPVGWAFCNGQSMPIAENEALFQLIGTTYGGDGQETFNMPDLQSRVPIHMGTGGGASYILAETGGSESVTLTVNQIPGHNHAVMVATAPGNASVPASNSVLSNQFESTPDAAPVYATTAPDTTLTAQTLGIGGGSQPHENRQPTLAVSYIISLFGIFPTQN